MPLQNQFFVILTEVKDLNSLKMRDSFGACPRAVNLSFKT